MSKKKTVLILTASLVITIKVLAQANNPAAQNYTNGKNNAALFGINIPVGEFSKTHYAGISTGYTWSHHRFGNLQALPKKIIGFTAEGSFDYYFGKKETIAGYDYRYGGYIYLHAFGGAIYNPCKRGNISLTTGPTLGIYKGSVDAGYGAKLGGSYPVTDKIEIVTGIFFLKHNDAAVLLAVSVQIGYCF